MIPNEIIDETQRINQSPCTDVHVFKKKTCSK